jgi:hypothetical protein
MTYISRSRRFLMPLSLLGLMASVSPFKANAQAIAPDVASSAVQSSPPLGSISSETFSTENRSADLKPNLKSDSKPDLVTVDDPNNLSLSPFQPTASGNNTPNNTPEPTETRQDPLAQNTAGETEPVGIPQETQPAGVPGETQPAGQPPSLQTTPQAPGQLPFVPKKTLLRRAIRYSPSITLLTPSAYGKSWGQVSVGGSFQSRTRYGSESDAAIGFGFGLGDARKAVGLDVGVGIGDVSGFQRGSIGLKLHRQLGNQLAIAVGVNNALTWGTIDGGISPYGVVTKGFRLREDPSIPFSQLYVSAGAGTGRYRSEDDVINNRNSVGAFGSVAVRVIEPMNLIAEWSGQDLTLGLSILPFRRLPLVFSPAVTDVTGTAGDGPRFTFGVGLGFSF